MNKLIVTDEVEIGHNKFCGGSTKISIEFENFDVYQYDINFFKDEFLNIIDDLDHSMIIDDENAKQFYKRYFIFNTDEMKNFYNDVAAIIFKKITNTFAITEFKDRISVTIELNKIRLTFMYDGIMDKMNIRSYHG